MPTCPKCAWHQPVAQVNHPDPAVAAIRTLEWKHMMEPELRERLPGTVITTETPYSPSDPGDYEYPFPDAANLRLYARYRERADAIPGLVMCGRLGDYRYYDMDQAIGRALTLAKRALAASNSHSLASGSQARCAPRPRPPLSRG